MKKKTAPKKASTTKTVKRTVPRSSSRSTAGSQTFIFRRIVVISACVVLAIGVMGTFDRPAVRGMVEGASTVAGLYSKATVLLPNVSPNDFTSFNIYYGTGGKFTNAVRGIPIPTDHTKNHYQTIYYLKNNVSYQYEILGLGKDHKEHSLPAAGLGVIKNITQLTSMQ